MRNRSAKTVLLAALLAPLLLIVGCEGDVQEPWVPSAETLQQERERSAAAQKALRERLAQVQADR